MAARLALIHSPFVGPGCWVRTAEALASRGWAVVAPDCGVGREPEPYAPAAQRIAAQLKPGDGPTILAVHSGAGGLAPALAAAIRPRPLGIVFVDATLPHPGRAWIEALPPPLAAKLRDGSSEGLAPRWNAWFDGDVLAQLIPDPSDRAAFEAELPRVPASFLSAPAPADKRWCGARLGFLRLSEAYLAEEAKAVRLGWTTAHEPLHHLAMITHPNQLAAALIALATRLGD